MKINKLFHWLYALVMFLPLLVLPIFALAVRSDNNFEPITIDTTTTTYTQKYNTNIVSNKTDLIVGNQYLLNYKYVSSSINIDSSLTDVTHDWYQFLYFDGTTYGTFLIDEVVYFNYRSGATSGAFTPLYIKTFGSYNSRSGVSGHYVDFTMDTYRNDNGTLIHQTDSGAFLNINGGLIVSLIFTYDDGFIILDDNNNEILDYSIFISDVPIDYNPFLENRNVGVTLNDTDFGSQTIYTLYKEVDTYFNYDNVFNFGDLYSWLNTNFFSGNAPLGFFIFWHLLVYWLLTSIIWLLFDVLIFVPQLIHRWLDKASIS